MNRRALLALLALCACGDDATPSDAGTGDAHADAPDSLDTGPPHVPLPFEPTAETLAYCPLPEADARAIEARITELLGQLDLRTKTRLLHGSGPSLRQGSWEVAGVAELGIPGLHMLDGPRGLSAFTEKNGTAFPVAMMRGATFDPELEREVGAAMAREHRSVGADVILAPTINVLRHPLWGRAQETYSEDVHHLGTMGVAFILGAQSEGVLASAKHYAANSIEDTRHEVDVIVDERTLREVYLPHFERAVREAGVASVMSAYNQVNGRYCDQNEPLLAILKDEWGFAGFVESDWFLGTHGDAESLLAGLDIEMPAGTNYRRLPARVAEGALSEHDIDEAVRRVLRAQLCYRLDERERVLDDPSARETDAHRALAREVARRGIVLLRNEAAGAPLLPLAAGTTLAVVGPLADQENIGDTGSSNVIPSEVVTPFEGLSARFDAAHVPALDAAGRDVVAARDVAVVVVGLTAEDEGEATIGAGDRETLALSEADRTLVREVAALHDRVVVVLMGGSAITIDFEDEVEALLYAFYPGMEGGHALADVVSGDVSPSGRLPFSIPVDVADLPPWEPAPTTATYGFLHGYRHLQSEGSAPRYPFGFGLSYARFVYGPLELSTDRLTSADETLEVSFDVTNEGGVSARDVPQLYVSRPDSAVLRAPEDLRAFASVELAAGETRRVTLTLRAADLRHYDVATRAWVLEEGAVELRVQAHAGAGADPVTATVAP